MRLFTPTFKTLLPALLLLIFGAVTSSLRANETAGAVTVTINGVRNNTGQARVSLFDNKKGFPSEHNRAVQKFIGDITNNTAKVSFDNVAPGTYAVSCYHDENEDGKFGTNPLGIPQEGYGASNDARSRFGPPKFKKAAFAVDTTTKIISINLIYEQP